MSATLSSGDAVTTPGAAPAALASATKRFGGVLAIRDVTFDLVAGEVLALLGENGAGKSTCVKLLAGVYQPDAGAVLIDGRPTERWSPLDASRRGIAVMHQHPGLFGDLSVYENIFLGHMPRNRLGGVDDDRMRRRTSELLEVGRPRLPPGASAEGAENLRAAAGRDRPRAFRRRPRPDHGRTDRRAFAARGRAAVRSGVRPQRPTASR